jgi:hypothetical protein
MSIEYSQHQAKLLAMLLEAMGLGAALLCSCTWRAGCWLAAIALWWVYSW